MDLKEHLSILNHFLIIYIERVKNGSFLKPTVLRFEPRLMKGVGSITHNHIHNIARHQLCSAEIQHFTARLPQISTNPASLEMPCLAVKLISNFESSISNSLIVDSTIFGQECLHSWWIEFLFSTKSDKTPRTFLMNPYVLLTIYLCFKFWFITLVYEETILTWSCFSWLFLQAALYEGFLWQFILQIWQNGFVSPRGTCPNRKGSHNSTNVFWCNGIEDHKGWHLPL